jgi:Uma2 family endonuclease
MSTLPASSPTASRGIDEPIIGLGWAGVPMTPEEFDAFDSWDENYRYELINGVLIVSPAADAGERGPNEILGHWLLNYKEQHPQGKSLDWTVHEHHVHTPNSRRRADRVIWTGLGRVPNNRRDKPTIIVEFVSRDRRDWQRDYVVKRQEYLAHGILEYWIIDRFRRQMTVICNAPTGPTEAIYAENQTYSSPLLPGFELPLAKLLGVADMLESAEEGES